MHEQPSAADLQLLFREDHRALSAGLLLTVLILAGCVVGLAVGLRWAGAPESYGPIMGAGLSLLAPLLVASLVLLGRSQALLLDRRQERLVHLKGFYRWKTRREISCRDLDHLRRVSIQTYHGLVKVQIEIHAGNAGEPIVLRPRENADALLAVLAQALGVPVRSFIKLPEDSRLHETLTQESRPNPSA